MLRFRSAIKSLIKVSHYYLIGFTACITVNVQATHTPAAFTLAKGEAQRVGIHGMLLFSSGRHLYASHLPMFHQPHDIQVLLEIELQPAHLQQLLMRELQMSSELWTISPQTFDLNQLSPTTARPLLSFQADIFRGHFERGGHPEFIQQQINIREVIWYRPLMLTKETDSDVATDTLQYRLIGDDALVEGGIRQFYQLMIDQRPAADHLISVQSKQRLPVLLKVHTNQRYATLQQLAAQLKLPDAALQQLYLELAELE